MTYIIKLLLIILLSVVPMRAASQELAGFQTTSRKTVSPEVDGNTVTFRLDADYASYVTLIGSWQQPGSDPMPMHKDRTGMWELTLTGVFPDLHDYHFEVDGVPVHDPSNPLVKDADGMLVSLFFVDGPRTRIYHPAARRGTVSYVTYSSRIFGETRRMGVYLPYGYNPASARSYPVLYLLHGERQTEESWTGIGCAATVLDNLIQSGRAVPMIVVMPDCDVAGHSSQSMSVSLVNEIIPYVEKHYRTYRTKLMRGVAGVDTGGSQALTAVLSHPEIFDYVCLLGSGVKDYPGLQSDLLRWKRAKFKLIWQGCGAYDGKASEDVRRLYDALQTVDMDNSLCMSNGGHEWRNWRYYFGNFVPILFKY